jgi:hypothetical protein
LGPILANHSGKIILSKYFVGLGFWDGDFSQTCAEHFGEKLFAEEMFLVKIAKTICPRNLSKVCMYLDSSNRPHHFAVHA